MDKIKLDIVGLSYSQTQSGAYALILGESGGKRRLPIIIGGFEAQAIAIELEKMAPSRPLTHDLFKTMAQTYKIQVKEVVIYNLQEGIFYAKIVCDREGVLSEIDARTSDAIALAVRFNCPIYTFENILGSAGILTDELYDDEDGENNTGETVSHESSKPSNPFASVSDDELKEQLDQAIENEDYEVASRIRDELKKRNA